MKDFANIRNLPHEVTVMESGDKGYNFNLNTVASSKMKDPPSPIPHTFTME